jgi:ATP-dependent Clp protease, protease subunit
MFLSKSEAQMVMPQVIERTPRGEVAMDVYTRLLKDRIIWLGAPIDAAVANTIMAQLLYLEHDDADEDIYMYINSPGGSVDAGLGIYDTMQFVQPDIVTICAGSSYSMATVLLCAGAKGKRFALPNAIIHQHPARIDNISGYTPDVQIHAKQMLNIENRLKSIIAQHTGQPLEKIETDFQRDRFFTSEEAVKYGLIDEIITRNPNL